MLLRSKLGSSSMTTKDLQIGGRTKFISSALLLSLQTKRLKGSPATDNHVTVQTNNAAALKILILSVDFFSLFPSPRSNCADALPVGFNVWHGETLLNPPQCSLPYEAQYLKSKKDVCLIHKFITSQNDALNERGHALIWNADFRKEVLIFKMSLDGLPFTPHPPARLPRPLAFSVASLSLRLEAARLSLCLLRSFFSHTRKLLTHFIA